MGRIRAIDWLRGLAVLFMIQTHSLVLLRRELRAGPLFDTLQWIDGLVAPSFILAAGFSMALTQVRAARSPGARGPRVRRTLRRLGEVLAVATIVNWAWFPVFQEPRWIVRMDILQCIGVALLIALPILFALAPRPAALVCASLGLAAIVFAIAPLAESVGAPWNRFLNQQADAVFPLLPWAGYVYLGAAAGAATAAKGARGAFYCFAALALAGAAVWLATPWLETAYPPHHFWVTNPANCARRWTQVSLIALALLGVERLAGEHRSRAVRFLEVFGTSSLAGYFFHEMLLFKRVFGFSFEAVWGGAVGWGAYPVLLALLTACTFVLTLLTDRLYQAVDQRLRAGGVRASA